jgi:hypothetical protein
VTSRRKEAYQIIMKKLLFAFLLFLVTTVASAQTPGQSQYPASLDNATSLPRAIDLKQSTLAAGINNSVTSFSVASGTGFNQPAVVWIDSEQINCTTLSTNTFSGCSRGQGGTAAASHLSGAAVQVRPSAVYINGLQDAVTKMQTLLGTNASQSHPTTDNVAVGISASGFLWKQITNAQIDPAAAIAYSKLNLTGAILNADLAGSIANSKLANSSVTIGSTTVTLGATSTTLTGLTSVNGTSSATISFNSDAGINRQAAKVISASSGGTNIDGWFVDSGTSRVSTQFDKTNTTLADITGLSANVAAGRTYSFEAVLFLTLDATGLGKIAIGGTATATNIAFDGWCSRAAQTSMLSLGFINSMGTATTAISVNSIKTVTLRGTITVNAAGTLTVQLAQSSASGTSSVLVGSTFTVRDLGN